MKPVMAMGGPHVIQWLQNKVSAGFPSPAEDFGVSRLDLDAILDLKHDSVFFMRVAGNSMVEYGIFNGDIVAIRKGKRPVNGNIVVVALDHEFLIKRLDIEQGRTILRAGNPQYKDIVLQEGQEAQCWGVVTATIKVFPSGVVHVRPG